MLYLNFHTRYGLRTKNTLHPGTPGCPTFLSLDMMNDHGEVHFFISEPEHLDRIAAEATIAAAKLRDFLTPPVPVTIPQEETDAANHAAQM